MKWNYVGQTNENLAKIFGDILTERQRQDDKWGEQNHPDGTGDEHYKQMEEAYKFKVDSVAAVGEDTWDLILLEEIYEALAESDVTKLRKELIESAAVIVAWVGAIDRRA